MSSSAASAPGKQTNRPEDSAFKQQRLKAWQPILTPRWVIGAFFLIGVVFIPIGAALKVASDKLFEQVILYDAPPGTAISGTNCSVSEMNQGYASIQAGAPMDCTLTFTVDRDLPAGQVINVFYQLTNFYQNHRRYVKSRDDPQLAGTYQEPSTLSTPCSPNGSYVAENGLTYWPCGLIATSFFNDHIRFDSFNGQSNLAMGLSMDETGIAWKTDVESKFKNPTGAKALNNWSTWMYLWQMYDQMSCYDDTTGDRVTCQTWSDLIPGAYGQGCAKCPANSTPQSEGGIAPPGGWDTFDPTPGVEGNATALYGVRDEHFVVWMRTAALPQFRKLYGSIAPPKDVGYFKKGDTLSFRIVPNFVSTSYAGSKAMVLATSNSVGSKSEVVGIAYLTVGSICWALALAFLVKHIVAPRKLGDTRYIVWRHAGGKTGQQDAAQ